MRLSSFLVAVLFLGATAPMTRPAVAEEELGPVTFEDDVPRKVLAFHYPWYGNPRVAGGSGRWLHWEGVEEAEKRIASSTNYPRLGPYDSHDPKLIARHCSWAKEAGIDGFIISWWGRGSFEDRAVERILDECHRAGLSATIYYEKIPNPKTPESTARDIAYVVGRYGGHSAWLSVDSEPVIFVYSRAISELGLEGWSKVVGILDRDPETRARLIGDRVSRAAAEIFAGIHTYNTAGALRGKDLDQVRRWAKETYPAWVTLARDQGRISTITIIPGYDDTKIRPKGFRVDRMNGRLYRCQWEEAIAADPDWILITSWNEWHEGSEIEPSVEYDKKYLDLTREYAAEFEIDDLP